MRYSLILLLSLSIVGCEKFSTDLLAGKWKASEVSENGVPLEVDLTPIGFEFSKDGYYHYTSTINYEEAGTYYLDGPFLYTMDTVNAASSEKAVKITSLTQDSLILLMSSNGKDKVMKLFRN